MITMLLAAVIGQCAASFPISVTADDTVPLEVRMHAIHSVALWNAAVGVQVLRWKVTPPADVIISMRAVLPRDTWIGVWQHKEGCRRIGVVALKSGVDHCPERWRRLIMHELGHALGIHHEDSKENASVMHWLTPVCGKNQHDLIEPALVKMVLEFVREARAGEASEGIEP